jgi:hypothetical protein
MRALVEAVKHHKLGLLATALALTLSVTGCASGPTASHGTDGIANFAIYGD